MTHSQAHREVLKSTAPVVSNGTDAPVSEFGQWVATAPTFGLGHAVMVWILAVCRKGESSGHYSLR
jgi:hypothetical protein